MLYASKIAKWEENGDLLVGVPEKVLNSAHCRALRFPTVKDRVRFYMGGWNLDSPLMRIYDIEELRKL